jgi:hypothetical protein
MNFFGLLWYRVGLRRKLTVELAVAMELENLQQSKATGYKETVQKKAACIYKNARLFNIIESSTQLLCNLAVVLSDQDALELIKELSFQNAFLTQDNSNQNIDLIVKIREAHQSDAQIKQICNKFLRKLSDNPPQQDRFIYMKRCVEEGRAGVVHPAERMPSRVAPESRTGSTTHNHAASAKERYLNNLTKESAIAHELDNLKTGQAHYTAEVQLKAYWIYKNARLFEIILTSKSNTKLLCKLAIVLSNQAALELIKEPRFKNAFLTRDYSTRNNRDLIIQIWEAHRSDWQIEQACQKTLKELPLVPSSEEQSRHMEPCYPEAKANTARRRINDVAGLPSRTVPESRTGAVMKEHVDSTREDYLSTLTEEPLIAHELGNLQARQTYYKTEVQKKAYWIYKDQQCLKIITQSPNNVSLLCNLAMVLSDSYALRLIKSNGFERVLRSKNYESIRSFLHSISSMHASNTEIQQACQTLAQALLFNPEKRKTQHHKIPLQELQDLVGATNRDHAQRPEVPDRNTRYLVWKPPCP